MIIFEDRVDKRHTVNYYSNCKYSYAIQLNEDNTYEKVMYMDEDNQYTWNNEVIIDATPEEQEAYRRHRRLFQKGDIIKIVEGRKMKNEIKTVASTFIFKPRGTYGHCNIEYLVFTDGTKVKKDYCIFL